MGIKAAISKKRKLGSSGRELAADSGMGGLGVNTTDVQVKTCTAYYNTVRSAMEVATTLEMCMDASRFGTKDIEITCVYAHDGDYPSSCQSYVTDLGTKHVERQIIDRALRTRGFTKLSGKSALALQAAV